MKCITFEKDNLGVNRCLTCNYPNDEETCWACKSASKLRISWEAKQQISFIGFEQGKFTVTMPSGDTTRKVVKFTN